MPYCASFNSLALMVIAAMGWFGLPSTCSADDLTSPIAELVTEECLRSLSDDLVQELIDSQTPERKLLRILNDWADRASRLQSIRASFKQSEVNDVYRIETVSDGTFLFETAERWKLEFKARKIRKSDSSSFRDKEGEPYSLASGTPYLLMRIDDRIYFAEPEKKQFSSAPITDEISKKLQFQSPWQFAPVLDSLNFQGHFRFRLQKESNDEFVLLGRPSNQKSRGKTIFEWDFFRTMFLELIMGSELVESPVQIRLNKSTLLPTVLRTKNVVGGQYVISFESIVSQNLDPTRKSRISTECLKGFVDFEERLSESNKSKQAVTLQTDAAKSDVPPPIDSTVPRDSPY